MGGNVASGKVVLARFETGKAIYIGVVIAGMRVSNRCVVKGICQGKLGDETRLGQYEVPKGMRVEIPSHRTL